MCYFNSLETCFYSYINDININCIYYSTLIFHLDNIPLVANLVCIIFLFCLLYPNLLRLHLYFEFILVSFSSLYNLNIFLNICINGIKKSNKLYIFHVSNCFSNGFLISIATCFNKWLINKWSFLFIFLIFEFVIKPRKLCFKCSHSWFI